MAIGVRELSRILLQRSVEAGSELDVVQIGGERGLLVVVVGFPAGEHSVSDAKIEDAGIAAATGALERGDVRDTLWIDEYLDE
jgi:hypothetical protein